MLVAFHTAHKLILMSHAPEGYRRLGRLVAGGSHAAAHASEGAVRAEEFMRTMAIIATRRRHTNVLQHMAGYFKDRLDPESKAELQATIDDYRRGSSR